MKLKELTEGLLQAEQVIKIEILLWASANDDLDEEYFKERLRDVTNARIMTIRAEDDLLVIEVDPDQEG